MAENYNNVLVAGSGVVYRDSGSAIAPTGTAYAMTNYTDLGTIGEGPITESIPAGGDITPIKNFAGATVRTLSVPSDDLPTYTFTLIEENPILAAAVYNGTVTQTVTEGSLVLNSSAVRQRTKWALKVLDGANIRLIYIPSGEITDIGDREFVSDDATKYELTITAHYDTTISGNSKTWDTRWKS